MIPAGTPLWACMAMVTGVGCWIASAVVAVWMAAHHRRERRNRRADITARLHDLRTSDDWGDHWNDGGLAICQAIWPDAPHQPREENGK